jgi:hypothetical protein
MRAQLHIRRQVTQSGEWLKSGEASKFSLIILCIQIESFSFPPSLHCIIEYIHGSPLSTTATPVLLWILEWLVDWMISRGPKARIYTASHIISKSVFIFVWTILIRAALRDPDTHYVFLIRNTNFSRYQQMDVRLQTDLRLTMQVHPQYLVRYIFVRKVIVSDSPHYPPLGTNLWEYCHDRGLNWRFSALDSSNLELSTSTWRSAALGIVWYLVLGMVSFVHIRLPYSLFVR